MYERCTLSRRTGSRGARPELGAVVLWSTRSMEVATPFFFFYLGFMCKCLWEAPVGDTLGSFKCCRVSAYSNIFILHCLSFAYKYLHCCK